MIFYQQTINLAKYKMRNTPNGNILLTKIGVRYGQKSTITFKMVYGLESSVYKMSIFVVDE